MKMMYKVSKVTYDVYTIHQKYTAESNAKKLNVSKRLKKKSKLENSSKLLKTTDKNVIKTSKNIADCHQL